MGNVKKIFGDSKVFLYFLLLSMTNFTQSIYASLSISSHIAARKELYLWLMNADNMNLWKRKIIVGERRILMTSLARKAADYVLKPENNDMRVSYFERIGCLITILLVDNLDAKIRPQGMEEGSFVIPKTRVILDGESEV